MKIALLGTRGIPAAYGGFETFAEELATRLVQRGHQVSVYGRRPFFKPYAGLREYQGVALRVVPTIMQKYLETPVHALVSFLDIAGKGFDVVLLCNAANAPFSFLVRLQGLPLLINVDGIERKRSKWNAFGRLWYRLGEWSSVRFATKVIADAEVIAQYYRETHGCAAEVITYGAKVQQRPPGMVLQKFNLTPAKYILYVSRLEPENNALGVIEAYKEVDTELPLVIVGDAPYAKEYIARLHAAADSRVVFTGFQFGEAYQELRSHCYAYIQATEVGGTHPALVEAMAYGNCVIANGTPENKEVLADAGIFYEMNNFSQLGRIVAQLLSDPELVRRYGEAARARALALYTWDRITEQYEELFKKVLVPSHS